MSVFNGRETQQRWYDTCILLQYMSSLGTFLVISVSTLHSMRREAEIYVFMNTDPQIKHTQNKLECSLDSHFTLDKAKHHRSAYTHWSHVIIVYCLWAAIMKRTDSSQDKTHRKCSLLSLLKQHTRLLIHISHKLQVKQVCWQQHTLLINTIQ